MTPYQARTINALALLGCCATLVVAFWYQFHGGELPCPLCLLQRAAFAAAATGFALNVRFGPKPSHYAVALLGAVAGAGISARQVALHIVPGTGGFGSTLLGLHFYTLALIAFVAMIAGVGVLLLADRSFEPDPCPTAAGSVALGTASLLLFLGVGLANAVSTATECGGGLCPDDPTRYEALDSWLGRSALP
ncbi:disulfide bond formation protein B [Methylobacterium sp. D54C]